MEDTKLIFNFYSTSLLVFIVPLMQTEQYKSCLISTSLISQNGYDAVFLNSRVRNINNFGLTIKNNPLSFFESSIIILS